MYYLAPLTVLLAVGWAATAPPCPEQGCSQTIYLGPRWGSKIIFPRGPGVNTTNQNNTDSKGKDGLPYAQRVQMQPFPYRRPISGDSDYLDAEESWYRAPQTGRALVSQGPTASLGWPTFTEYINDNRNLNFSSMGITGYGVKESLSKLDADLIEKTLDLYLSRNNIQHLPQRTFPVALEYSLQKLFLNDNPLRYLSSSTTFELSRLGNLKVLSLARTELSSLEKLPLSHLEVLDLSDNRLSYVPDSLNSLIGLRELYLAGNRISTMYGPPPTPKLQVLSLTANQLAYLGQFSFKGLYWLDTVYLNNNSLKLASDLFLQTTTRVYLSDNPWQCSCPLLNIVHQTWPRVVDKENITCVDDVHEFPRSVSDLTSRDVHLGCSGAWDWLKVAGKPLMHAISFCYNYVPDLSTILTFLGCVFFLIMIARALRGASRKIKTCPSKVPYNILDDSMLKA